MTRFESVSKYLSVLEKFQKAKALLDANLKWFVKKHGNKGGSERLPDGILTLTSKEPNGKDSPSYKAMLEDLEQLILDGKLYHLSKDNAARFMMNVRKKHTKSAMASQKIEATLDVTSPDWTKVSKANDR